MSTAKNLLRNTAALSAGQVAAKVLGIAYLAVLARHLHAEGMGQLATAQSLATLVFLFVGPGSDVLTARDVAQDHRRASLFFWNVFALKLAFSAVGLAVLWIISSVAHYPPEVRVVVIVYGIVTTVGSLVSTNGAIFQATERLALNAALQFFRDVFNIGLSIVALELGAGLLVIVWISVLVSSLQVIALTVILRRLGLASFITPSFRQTLRILKRGLPFTAASLVSRMFGLLNPVILSLVTTAAVTGAYWAANNILLVMLIIPTTFAQSVFPVFARHHVQSGSALRDSYRNSFKAMTVIGMPLTVGALILAEPVVTLLYGNSFEESVPVLRLLALTIAMSGSFASGTALSAMGRQGTLVIGTAGALFVLIGLSLLLVPPYGVVGAAIAYLVPTIGGFIFYGLTCHRALGLPIPAGMLLRTTSAAALMAASVYLGLRTGVPLGLLVCAVGPGVYLGGLALFRILNLEEWRLIREVTAQLLPPGAVARLLQGRDRAPITGPDPDKWKENIG